MLKGKNIIVTGCLKGIGRKTLDLMAQNNANVFACAQFQTEEFEAYTKKLSDDYGVEIIPLYFDLTKEDEIKDAVMQIRKTKKNIDALVNIAGYTKDALFQMVSMNDMQTIFQINFFSQIIFSQYIVKLMLRSGSPGSIVNISSISGLDGSVGQLAYSSSKAALAAATKVMAQELGKNGIRVNAVAPGFIDTDMYSSVPAEIIQGKVARTKLKRMGQPEEVAEVIKFLVSDQARHITGQIVRIDGGKGYI